MEQKRVHWNPAAAMLLVLTMLLGGCAGPTAPQFDDVTLNLQAAEAINDGVLLPIDIMAVNEIKADAVLAVAPDLWFGNEQREKLTPEEIQKVAIRGGGKRQVTVRVPSLAGKIILYADYENSNERAAQQIIISPLKGGFHEKYEILIQANRLELKP